MCDRFRYAPVMRGMVSFLFARQESFVVVLASISATDKSGLNLEA
jgi:hypothetical protein